MVIYNIKSQSSGWDFLNLKRIKMKHSERVFNELKDHLHENACDFFINKDDINKYFTVEDLLENSCFEEYKPFNAKTNIDKLYNALVELVINKILSLPQQDKEELAKKIVEETIDIVIEERMRENIRRILNSHNLYNNIEKILKSQNESYKLALKEQLVPAIVRKLKRKEGINNLLFELVGEVDEISSKIKIKA